VLEFPKFIIPPFVFELFEYTQAEALQELPAIPKNGGFTELFKN
jgi:hypothetical protein